MELFSKNRICDFLCAFLDGHREGLQTWKHSDSFEIRCIVAHLKVGDIKAFFFMLQDGFLSLFWSSNWSKTFRTKKKMAFFPRKQQTGNFCLATSSFWQFWIFPTMARKNGKLCLSTLRKLIEKLSLLSLRSSELLYERWKQ